MVFSHGSISGCEPLSDKESPLGSILYFFGRFVKLC